MKRERFILALAIVAGLAITVLSAHLPQGPASAPVALALVGGTLIDGGPGQPVRNSVVLIRGDRIEKVGTVESLPVPAGYEQIPTEGMTVLPGLWDLHVHLIYSGHPNARYWFKLRLRVREGDDTCLRRADADGRRHERARPCRARRPDSRRQEADRERRDPGPTLYVAGPALTGNRTASLTPQFLAIQDVADARAKARKLIDDGVDVVKIFNPELMSIDERRAIVAEAARTRIESGGPRSRPTETFASDSNSAWTTFNTSGLTPPNFQPTSSRRSASACGPARRSIGRRRLARTGCSTCHISRRTRSSSTIRRAFVVCRLRLQKTFARVGPNTNRPR